MKSPTTFPLLCLFLVALFFYPELVKARSTICHIEAFIAQVPVNDCELNNYPVVFKPSQPHSTFVQNLNVRSRSGKIAFSVEAGDKEYRLDLKPGVYQFEITDPTSAYCSTIQQLVVKGSQTTTSPVVTCRDLTIQLGSGGKWVSPIEFAAQSQSPCGSFRFESSQSFFSLADVGKKRVKVTIIDSHNRKQSCYSEVTIKTHEKEQFKSGIFDVCHSSSPDNPISLQNDGYFRMAADSQPSVLGPKIVSQARWGDGEIKVHLSRWENVHQQGARAGIIIKESCTPSAPYIAILLESGTGNLYKDFRLMGNGEVVKEWEHRVHSPTWLKLTRKEGQFKAYVSHNGLHWQLAYSTSMQVGAIMQWGMIMESGSPTDPSIAVFEKLSIQTEANSPYPPVPRARPSLPKSKHIAREKNDLPDTYQKPKKTTIMDQEQWSIFPNPAQDYLEVTLPIWKDDHATLHLLNSAGKTILKEQLDVLNGQSHWMNLATVARGIYYLKLQTVEGQHLTKKVIVDK